MDEKNIGEIAGVIWKFLKESGSDGVSLGSLKKIEGFKADQVVAAVGWLAREGKLSFSESGNRINISLNDCEFVPS